MKTIHRTILLVLAIIGCFVVETMPLHAQYIWAGQVTGDHIYWSNIDDVLVTTDEHLNLDINQDGIDDISLVSFYESYHTGYTEGSFVDGLNENMIATVTYHNWVKQYQVTDTIGYDCLWSTASIIRSYTWDIVNGESWAGVFTGMGFVGFIIPQVFDTITGWIRINSTSETSLWVYDYAYYSVTTGLINKDISNFQCNKLVNNTLLISNNELPEPPKLNAYIYDLSGSIVLQGQLTGKTTEINVSQLSSGLYLLIIKDNKNNIIHKPLKFIRN